jgi:acetyl esterase
MSLQSVREAIERRVGVGLLGAAGPVAGRLAGAPVRSPEGYVLDPRVSLLMQMGKALGVAETHTLPLDAARAEFERSIRLATGPLRRGLHVWEQRLPGAPAHLRVRVYRPADRAEGNPGVVFFHGGGFVLGSLDSHDELCRTLALDAGAAVVAVHYRRAPEHSFPAAWEDAVAAFRAVAEGAESLGIRADRLGLAGDSAGGNLAAGVALATRADRVAPVFQWLIYPATDFTRALPSHTFFPDAPILPKASIDLFLARYAPDPATHTDPRASPLFADDLTGVAPALVQTAGFDPLRDEGHAYADRLRAAGVAAETRCETTLPHGWAQLGVFVPAAAEAVRYGVGRVRAALQG